MRVRHAQVVFRHGDRAPGYNCRLHRPSRDGPDGGSAAEEEFWRAELPEEATRARLRARFPVHDAAGAPPTDASIFPWGALTAAGARQLYEVGCALAKRYQLPPVGAVADAEGGAGGGGAAAGPDVHCTASNYHRTQLSSQSLLAGLFDTVGGAGAGAAGLLAVSVLPLARCPINTFDRPGKGLLQRCVAMVSDEGEDAFAAFAAAEEAARAPKTALTDGRIPAFAGQPHDEVRWINFFDYYQCRDRRPAAPLPPPAAPHGPPLLAATDDEALRAAVHSHVCWRFGQWYADDELIRLAAGPLLREIIAQMLAARDALRDAEAAADADGGLQQQQQQQQQQQAAPPQLRLFGGHDVSLLALEWALRTPRALSREWWPPYGSSLAFELLQRTGASADDEFFVRVVADARDVLQVGFDEARTTARDGLIPLSHWDRLVPLDTFVAMLADVAIDSERDCAEAAAGKSNL